MLRSRRIIRPERMDDPDIDARALSRALRHLALSNRITGATRLVCGQFANWSKAWARDETLRVLDIGTGSADTPLALDDWARRRGFALHITAVDLHPRTLALARQKLGDRSNIELIELNALDLMGRFSSGSFHYVHAGLFLHHLQEIEVLTVLRIMDRLATRGMVWNDLQRSWPMKVLFRSLAWTGPAVFRHDAVASIDAAFTKREALDLAKRAGWSKPQFRGWLGHRFLITSQRS